MGLQMARYSSAREALAWLFACDMGPKGPICSLARSREPRGRAHRTQVDLIELYALVFSAEVGLRRGSVAYDHLRSWATSGGQFPYHALCGKARMVLRLLRRALQDRGLLNPPTPPPDLDVLETTVEIWERGEGAEHTMKAQKELRTVRAR
jgi:hypothetical protein